MVNFPAIALLGATLVSAAPRGWEDWGDKSETTSISVPKTTSPAFPSTSDPLHWADWSSNESTSTSRSSTLITSSKTSSTSKQSTTASSSNGHGWGDWNGNRPNRPHWPGPVNNGPASVAGNIPYVKPTNVQGNAATQIWGGSAGATQTLSAPWAQQPALFSQSAPTATLKPALHWDHQPRNLNHIVPGDNQKIYFAGGQISESRKANC